MMKTIDNFMAKYDKSRLDVTTITEKLSMTFTEKAKITSNFVFFSFDPYNKSPKKERNVS